MSYEQLGSHLSAMVVAARAKNADEERIDAAVGLFRPYLALPNPVFFDPILADLNRALAHLFTGEPRGDPFYAGAGPFTYNPILNSELDWAAARLRSWTGPAAQLFATELGAIVPAITRNQFMAVLVLAVVTQAERALWEQVRITIDQVAERAVGAIGLVDAVCRRHDWVIHFTAAQAVREVLDAGFPRDHFPPTLGFALDAASALPGGRPELRVGGGTANAVLDSLHGAVHDCTRHLAEVERALATMTRRVVDVVASQRRDFTLPRPAEVDAPTLVGAGGLGDPIGAGR